MNVIKNVRETRKFEKSSSAGDNLVILSIAN